MRRLSDSDPAPVSETQLDFGAAMVKKPGKKYKTALLLRSLRRLPGRSAEHEPKPRESENYSKKPGSRRGDQLSVLLLKLSFAYSFFDIS